MPGEAPLDQGKVRTDELCVAYCDLCREIGDGKEMAMDESIQNPGPNRFTEAAGVGVNKAFKDLASEIMKDGAMSRKEKTLIALACAVAVRCDHCVWVHKERAKQAGASKEEMMEAAAIAGLIRMGSGFNAALPLLED